MFGNCERRRAADRHIAHKRARDARSDADARAAHACSYPGVQRSITPDQRIKAHLPKYDPLASQSAEEVSELSRLAQQQQWTEVQNAFLDASKACVIGRAIPFPTSNKGDPEAACQWDCWRRATMLEPLAWDVLHNGIAGDFIEAGVYKGGISVHMEALLHAFYSLRGTTTHAPRERVRQMWLADSFGGLPPSKA